MDIVERLRAANNRWMDCPQHHQKTMADAGAEIERLRAALIAARAMLQHHSIVYADEIDEALEQPQHQ